MTWLNVFFAYIQVVDAVITTADVWFPTLVGGAALGWGVHRLPRRGRHRRTRRPDTSGQDAHTPPDIGAQVTIPQH
ncbi:hypothetical protein [Streptomyces sp. A5-4]|uniref:hypothetical protein n=1 Tax=Streptomyces sp. A5-4 TaxID=3384771 RepID=UPI003DA989C8